MKPVFLAAALLIAACATGPGGSPTVNVNMSYSNAGGFGTQNSGDYRAGSMFVWNTATNQMQFIDTLDLSPTSEEVLPGNRSSSAVAGIGLTGIPASLQGQEATLRASIGAQSSFSASGAYRQDYSGVVTALSNHVAAMLERGDDPDLTFRPRDRDYRVVVIRSVLRAEQSSLRIGGTDASNPNSVAQISLGDIASVNVQAGTSTTCGSPGAAPEVRPVCFFNVVVYKPTYLEGNPRLQWDPNAGYPAAKLPDAFRGLR